MSNIQQFTKRHFIDSVSQFDQPLLIKFYAPWCDDCDNIAPMFQNLASQYASNVQFGEINIDTHDLRDYYQGLGIDEIPSFVVYFSKEDFMVKKGDNDLEAFVADLAKLDGKEFRAKWDAMSQTSEQTSEHSEYELIVVGGGSGGISCARQASKFTKGRIAIVDWVSPSVNKANTWDLGGTCINVGCVPKFLYHRAAAMGDTLRDHASFFGWNVDAKEHNWDSMQRAVQLHIKKLNWKYERALKGSGVQYIHAKAQLKDNNTLELTDADGKSRVVHANKVVISTGARPHYPDFEGAREHCISSDDVFFLKQSPGKTLVIGGGYIAVETAGFLAGLNNSVTLSIRSKMLRKFDAECVSKVRDSLTRIGVNVLEPCSVQKVEQDDSGKYKVTFEGDSEQKTFDTVFVATGRTPNTQSLNLDTVGVKLSENNYIVTNDYSETSVSNIFAIGDVVEDAPELTPAAILSGRLLARRMFLHTNQVENHSLVPTCIFSPNEYASCGLNEEQANQVYGSEHVKVYRKTVRVLEHELHPDHPNDAFGKLICLRNDEERVIGFHFVGPKAGEVCQGVAVAMRLGVKKEDFDMTVGIHPTVAEMFCSLEYGVEEDVGCGCG